MQHSTYNEQETTYITCYQHTENHFFSLHCCIHSIHLKKFAQGKSTRKAIFMKRRLRSMLVCITLKRKLRTISYKTFTNIKTTFLTGFMFVKLQTIFATAKILKINPSLFIVLLCTKDNKNENFKRSLLLFCIRILAINLYNLY